MARPLRIQAAGLTYHVTSRGVRRTNIFLDQTDRRRFLSLLAKVVERYGLRCHAYCEMTNHYHLAVTTAEANLSRAVQQLNGAYASWWNWRHRRMGHVFQARFHSQIVQEEVYLANVCRYIVLNPVRAGLVRSPAHWPWSSYRATVGLCRRPTFLDCDRLLTSVGPGEPDEGVNRFRRFVVDTDVHALKFPRTAIAGDEAFIARFAAHRARASREVPRHEGRRALETIFQDAVTRNARNDAVVTAFRERYAVTEIARFLELHRTTVSKIVGEHRCQSVKKPTFHDLTPGLDEPTIAPGQGVRA